MDAWHHLTKEEKRAPIAGEKDTETKVPATEPPEPVVSKEAEETQKHDAAVKIQKVQRGITVRKAAETRS